MASDSYSVLKDLHPRHIVYPFNDEERATYAVYIFASSGLSRGESVVLIATDSRADSIRSRLSGGGFDLKALTLRGQLVFVSAENMLRGLMADGKLNEVQFKEVTSQVIRRARLSSLNRRVRIFGEMVSLLVARNEITAAEELEMLWNSAIDTHDISLFCTYALLECGFKTLPDSLLRLHNHALETEGDSEPTQRGAYAAD